MTILTDTAKGQVTLRKEVLQHLGVKPGDKIAADGKARLSAVKPKDTLKGFIGSLHQPGEPARSLEEIDQAIRDGWAGKR